jgi:hypothetical protein
MWGQRIPRAPEVARTQVFVSQGLIANRRPYQPKPRPAGPGGHIHRHLSRADVNELNVMTLAFEDTGKPLVTRTPPAPAAARNEYVPTFGKQLTDEMPNLTTSAHPDGGADAAGAHQRAVRLTESGQIMSASGQINAERHDVRDEHDEHDSLVGRQRLHHLERDGYAVLAGREDVDVAPYGDGPSDNLLDGHDHIIETITQKRAEERLKSP